MDSPYFMRFCFLLLTIAAPYPNIAMPSDNRAEGTQNSSSSKTHVTAYHCKDRESNICKSSNYEGCDKIGETQNKEFSNEIIDLETNETHITMCFQQENTCPEGVYAIFWVKDVGMGDSCGILNSRENVNGSTIKICCEAEINLSVPNHLLTCYTKASDEKDRKSTADPIGEENLGNPQFSISQNSSIGIITPLLIIGVGAALAVYCARRNRNRQGRVTVLHHYFFDKFEGFGV